MAKNAEKENKYQKLKFQRARLEETSLINAHLAWNRLSGYERAVIRAKWDEYYSKAKETRSAQIWNEMGIAYRKKDFGTVSELKQESIELRLNGNWIPKPSEYSPYDVEMSSIVRAYISVLNELKSLDGENYVSKAEQVFNGSVYYNE